MIPAFQKDEALLADIREAPEEKNLLHCWWLGQSGFFLKWTDRHYLFDPYLSDSLTKKYASTDKPHVRMSERVVDPGKLDMVELVTSSHAHTDHLDPETLQPLLRANPGISLVVPRATLETARERAGDTNPAFVPLDAGDVAPGEAHFVTAVAAAHNEVETDSKGNHLYLGYILRVGPFAIYHSGDTRMHDGLVPALLDHRLDLALLPINGHDPARRVAGNLRGAEAASLAWAVRARMVVPCHYDMFEFNTASPGEFVAACGLLGQAHAVLRGGERLTLEAAG